MKKVMDVTEIVSRPPKGLGRTKKARAVPGVISSGPQARGQQEMLVILFSAYVFSMPEPSWVLSPPQ